MRSLRFNIPEVEVHYLFETGIDKSIPLQESAIPGYMSLIAEQHHQNRHGHGHGVYIKDGFPCGSDQKTRILIRRIWHLSKVPLSFSLSFHFLRTMFGRKSETIDNILTECPSARFYINGDFNIDQKESLIHSKKTNEGGRYCRDFSVAY